VFALPAPAEPENPTGRETLQMCMAILAAMGVAAAQGMWHRARRRQAIADEARANADKAQAKAAAGGHGGGRGGSRGGGGLLTSSRHEGGSRKRPGGFQTGGHGDPRHPGGGRRKKDRKGPHRDPHDDSHGGSRKRDRKDSHKAPKDTPDGRTSPDRARPKRRKRGKVKGGLDTAGPCVKNRKPRKPRDKTPGDKDGKAPKATKDGKRRAPGPDTSAPKKRPSPLKWKARKKSRPGPGGDKALPPGRKRWKRPTPTAPTGKPDSKRRKDSKDRKGRKKRGGKRRPRWMRWTLRWTWSPEWAERRWARRMAASSATATGSTGATDAPSSATGAPHEGGRESWTRTPPRPPRGTEWMRPPPGADHSVRVESCERVDEPPRPPQQSEAAAVAGAPAGGRLALPPAAVSSTGSPSTTSPRGPASTNGASPTAQTTGGHMSRRLNLTAAMPTHGVQYDDDAELTIRDVIEAAADMAEEITAGVEDARATADGCERMASRLEALHVEIVELKVPGWLAAIWVRLIDKALHVKALAEGLAEALPAASEAIATAASNAAARHLNPADVTRDHGHIRPAEREYHDA
jgi:hypothetical protein